MHRYLLALVALLGGGLLAPGMAWADIYQEIVAADANRLTLTRRGAGGRWIDAGADIRLDEQRVATSVTRDAAPRPLFAAVDEEKLREPTFRTFFALLDNYEPRVGKRETSSAEEEAEIEAFLDAAFASAPMRRALQYLRDDLQMVDDWDEARRDVRAMWFDFYTNHFGGHPDPFVSGFEHVFVGEATFDPDAPNIVGDIGGYHNWLKFYWDEQAGRVNYLGYNYGSPAVGDAGSANPQIATIRMTWEIHERDNGRTTRYRVAKRPRGGFFVGLSPECELALGTVACYEAQAGRFRGDGKKRVTLLGAEIELTLYRNVTRSGEDGQRIRTFYPAFLRDAEAAR